MKTLCLITLLFSSIFTSSAFADVEVGCTKIIEFDGTQNFMSGIEVIQNISPVVEVDQFKRHTVQSRARERESYNQSVWTNVHFSNIVLVPGETEVFEFKCGFITSGHIATPSLSALDGLNKYEIRFENGVYEVRGLGRISAQPRYSDFSISAAKTNADNNTYPIIEATLSDKLAQGLKETNPNVKWVITYSIARNDHKIFIADPIIETRQHITKDPSKPFRLTSKSLETGAEYYLTNVRIQRYDAEPFFSRDPVRINAKATTRVIY